MCQQLGIGEAVMLAIILMAAASMEAEVPKRAPSGFMGMRGKKDGNGELVYEDMEKGGPGMGFQGMTGKKDQYDDQLQETVEYYEKRAPGMGFQGMRGKKDNDVSSFDDVEKRAPSMGFQGMRGKKDQNLIDELDIFEKRAPGMGFQGMRGKKDAIEDFKRAPSMGFQGMRGKKDQDDTFGHDFELPNLDQELELIHNMSPDKDDEGYYKADGDDIWGEGFEKRAPSGFFGMRGKKQPNSGFFGMRGKKAPSGFMGMRGKKAPSGFMGMRGKKEDSTNLDLFLDSLEAEELRNQAGSQLRHLDDATSTNVRQKRYRGPKNIKKAPSGFMGMRGKKWDSGLQTRDPQVGGAL